jgi:hypothetical protein
MATTLLGVDLVDGQVEEHVAVGPSPKHASAIFRVPSSFEGRPDRRHWTRLSCSRAGSGMTGRPGRLASADILNNRYHDPTLGRFISVDPLVNVTHDAYGYGKNNPISYSDPSGLEPRPADSLQHSDSGAFGRRSAKPVDTTKFTASRSPSESRLVSENANSSET